MSRPRSILILLAIIAGILVCDRPVSAQGRLTYPELSTALQVKLPNQSFKNKNELISWLVGQIKTRKVDKPLTSDREEDLRQAGATDNLISAIKANSPGLPTELFINLGELTKRAVNLVKPEYSAEAQRLGVSGVVTLEVTVDEQGRVISTKTVAGLKGGLTEQAIAAAKASTFTPATSNGRPAKGIGTITYNFKLNKIDPAAVLATADDLRKKFNCTAAITEYTRIISVEPRHERALAGRGICYVISGGYDRAIVDLDLAIKLVPSEYQAIFYRGLAYELKGSTIEADKNYEQALGINPELNNWPLMNCVFIDRRQITRKDIKDYADDVIKACNASMQGAPEFLSGVLYLKRGIGNRLKSEFERSIADLESAKRASPQLTTVQRQLQITYNARGLERYEKKDIQKAIEDLTTAIGFDPRNATPYVNRCAVYVYGARNYDQGITDCTAAIRLTDRSSMAYNHRGFAYEKKNSLKEAIDDYRKALQIDPQNQAALANLNRAQKPKS